MSKRSIVFFIIGLLIACSTLGVFIFVKNNYVVPVLMYHSVSPFATEENRLSVRCASFERQMRFLKKHRYHVITLSSLAEMIKSKQKIPRRTVVLTFDDGYRDNFTYAFPVLKKYNLPATIFVIISEVGRIQGDRLTWEEIYEMQHSGIITFGSHALGPEPLINIANPDKVKKEIYDSKKALEGKLKTPVESFSYPEGRFNPAIRQLVKDAGYTVAVATSPGKGYPNDDAWALKRLRISSTSDNLFVFWFEISGIYTFIKEHRDDP
ncbi:MAG: polysaccharide deacetylase family protein [Candidatus Omnitrophota bacterium]|jgi:peptidoglycan/xylan/chitin deacetylase (PgdA/CDA1 family)|nr:MAG: polysaccharide deacetylase family protein [Candidatus Omnitrophota bacterium]